jgi:hypothetical protein
MENEKFKALLDKKTKQPTNFIIPNSSLENAVAALIKMFELAETEIQLLVRSFDSNIPKATGYKEALEAAIKRNVRVEVLFTNKPDTNSIAYQFLLASRDKEEYSNSIDLRTLSVEAEKLLNDEIDNDGQPFLYAVADKVMYRFEKDTVNHYAWINYCDSKRSERLSQVFTDVFNLSDPIPGKILEVC